MLISVNSNELRSVLKDVSYLGEETLQFITVNDKLRVHAGTKLNYTADIDIVSEEEYEDTSISVKYVSMYELLGAKGQVELLFIVTGVILKYGTLSVTLGISSELLTDGDVEIPELVPFSDGLRFSAALQLFRKVGIFQKTLSMERPLQLMGDIALLQFPTVWFRVRSSDINAVITKEQANIISKFEPTHYAVDSRLILQNYRARLLLPITTAPAQDEFIDLLDEMHSLCKIATTGLLSRVKVLYSVFGNANCTVSITETNLYFTVVTQSFTVTDTIDEEVLFTFTTRLEYLVALLSLFPDDYVEILVKEGALCLRDSMLACILSIGGRSVF